MRRWISRDQRRAVPADNEATRATETRFYELCAAAGVPRCTAIVRFLPGHRTIASVQRAPDGSPLLLVSRAVVHAPTDQRDVVLAHEVGHLALHHLAGDRSQRLLGRLGVVGVAFLTASVVVLVGLAWSQITTGTYSHLGAYQGLILAVTGCVVMAGRARRRELAADRFAAHLGHPFTTATISWEKSLGRRDVAAWESLLTEHPRWAERLRAAAAATPAP